MPASQHKGFAEPYSGRATILSRLAVDELAALVRYARIHGRFWKTHLRDAWATGRDEREDDGPALRRIRNMIGPSGLTTFALRGLEDELAARGSVR